MAIAGCHRHCEPKFNFWRNNPVIKHFFFVFIYWIAARSFAPLAMTIDFIFSPFQAQRRYVGRALQVLDIAD